MWRKLFRQKKQKTLDLDEIFLDSKNLPFFNNQQFEGQIERPITKRSLFLIGLCFALIGVIFIGRIGFLQVVEGEVFAERSEQNKLRHTTIFPDRGVIYDRFEKELAWNNPDRIYTPIPGFGHLVGYVGFPTAVELDRNNYHPEEMIGKEGIERIYNNLLGGQSGLQIEEVDAKGTIHSNHVLREAESGKSLYLSIDSRVQSALYRIIANIAQKNKFVGGAGVIIDIKTGEILSLVSYPEYDPTIMAKGDDRPAINGYINNKANPFLNRAVSGSYAPGSVVKPFMALAVLKENIISPEKEIVSTGQLVVPNPYYPDQPSIFKDWRAHGAVDMRRALAVSSDVYFYQVGGGFGSQRGLGINLIEQYMKKFGFGSLTNINFPGEVKGVVPGQAWKAETFDGEPWRLGNTYHTAIGQYGFLVTPLQIARGIAAIANGGKLLTPSLIKGGEKDLPITNLVFSAEDFKIVTEGMRLAVTSGTATTLNVPYVEVAAKTGTAEVGLKKEYINGWITGFFPYNEPRYAFAVVMERGPQSTLTGSTVVMRQLLDYMYENTPEYFTTSNF